LFYPNLGAIKIIHLFQFIKVKKDEMGGTFSTYGSYKKCIQEFGWKIWRKETIQKS